MNELIEKAIEKARSLIDLLNYVTNALSKIDNEEAVDAIETVYGEVNDLSISIDELREAITHSQPIADDGHYYAREGIELDIKVGETVKPDDPETKTTIIRFCSNCKTEYEFDGTSYFSKTGVFTVETNDAHCCAFCGEIVVSKTNHFKIVSLKALNSIADIIKPKTQDVIKLEPELEIDYYPDPIIIAGLQTYFPVKENLWAD